SKARKGQHLRHVTHVGLMHSRRASQVALVFGGLLGQDVTLEGLCAFDGPTGTNAETLLRSALGLHLGHVNAPLRYFVLVRRREVFSRLDGPEPLIESPRGPSFNASAEALILMPKPLAALRQRVLQPPSSCPA